VWEAISAQARKHYSGRELVFPRLVPKLDARTTYQDYQAWPLPERSLPRAYPAMANPTPFDGTTTNKSDFVVRARVRGWTKIHPSYSFEIRRRRGGCERVDGVWGSGSIGLFAKAAAVRRCWLWGGSPTDC
jgi:hypothetical protein